MPYILAPTIKKTQPGMWMEGNPYEVRNIYSIDTGKLPPVNYDSHILKPHSLTHVETSKHVTSKAPGIDHYYKNLRHFYGEVIVLKLSGNNYQQVKDNLYLWEISKDEIVEGLKNFSGKTINKIFITSEFYPVDEYGYHDPQYVLVLGSEAASYLIDTYELDLIGNSWKSSDFKPGLPDRPIHQKLFQKALIVECLDLKEVPQGIYFLTCFPLPLEGASESPVVPVLFSKNEINF